MSNITKEQALEEIKTAIKDWERLYQKIKRKGIKYEHNVKFNKGLCHYIDQTPNNLSNLFTKFLWKKVSPNLWDLYDLCDIYSEIYNPDIDCRGTQVADYLVDCNTTEQALHSIFTRLCVLDDFYNVIKHDIDLNKLNNIK